MSQWIGSPNYTQGRQGNNVLGVIIHWMAGNLASTDSVFQDRSRNTSAHYGVEDGNVHQYVKEEDTAYQAGNWGVNLQTIGIEHSAQPGRDASDATYESSAQLIAAAAKRWGFAINSNTIRPHNAIVATQCPGTIDVGRLIRRANELLGGAAPSSSPSVPTPVAATGKATVTVDTLNVRSAPNTSAPAGQGNTADGNLHNGDVADIVGAVQGESVQGISTWLKTVRGNYIWAGGTNWGTTPAVQAPQGGRAEAIRVTNVRVAPNTGAALGGSQQLQPGQYFDYSAKVRGQNVSQNGVTTDLWYHSNVGNYVWAGNCKDI